MTKAWPHGRNGWVATLAALLLAVQGLLLAASTGADAGAMPLDRFGNVLCTADAGGGHGGQPSPGGRSPGGLDCCTLACPMFGGPAPLPASAVPATGRAVPLERPFALHEVLANGPPPSPRQARAPPASA